LLVAFLNAGSGIANDPVSHGAARSQGMANASVMLADPWSGVGNPAGLAVLTNLAFSIHYENYFLVPDLGLEFFSCGMPTKTGTFGISYSTFGYSFYRESQACLSFGKSFGNKFRAGIGLHYLMIRQSADLGNLSALVPALGIQAIPMPGLTIGLQVFNPAGQQYVPTGHLTIPTLIDAGLGYELGGEIFICFETEKRSLEKLKYYGGIEINLQKLIIARFGVSSGEYPGYSFGLGFQIRPLTIDIAATHHPVLGFSPAITISLGTESGKKKIRKLVH